MYRRRAKLRDIMHVVDRHNTGAMPRDKLHLCLELADLPVPDRTSEQKMYGKFMSREVFRYNDFLDAMKYDPAYRHLLTSRWHKLSGGSMMPPPMRQAPPKGGSFTPEPTGAGLMLPAIAQARGGGASRAPSSKGVGSRRLRDAFLALDKGKTGTLTIEELQQGLVALDLVPTATNAALMELFRVCDRDGHGNIDYNELVRMIQERDAAGKPMFIPGYRGGGRMMSQSQGSRGRGSTTTPGTLLSAMNTRLATKYAMLKSTLESADRAKRGTIPLDTLKDVLLSLNILDKAQLKTGELDSFFGQYTKQGQVDYGRFADSVKAQDLAQLAGLGHGRT